MRTFLGDLATNDPHLAHRALRHLREMACKDTGHIVLEALVLQFGKGCDQIVAPLLGETAQICVLGTGQIPNAFCTGIAQFCGRGCTAQIAAAHLLFQLG